MTKGFLAACALAIAFAVSAPVAKAGDLQPSGAVTISQTQVTLLVSGTVGGGHRA